jgi:hypothetical protein
VTYTPVNAATMSADGGVGSPQTYNRSYFDAGSPGTTTLQGSHTVPFARVAYVPGQTLSSGQYAINPATNEYHFSAADAGRTVTVWYSFNLATVKRQTKALIPANGQVTVGSSARGVVGVGSGGTAIPFAADGGVIYYSDGFAGNPDNGAELTRVSGTPTQAGTYSISGTEPAVYQFSSADVGREVLLTYELNNTNGLEVGTPTTLSFQIFEGYAGQAPAALLESNYAGADFGYTGIAFALFSPMDLGYGAQIQQNVYEVQTGDAWGGGIHDCSPVACILRVLTDKVWGLGAGTVPFPASAIDNGAGGTWGTPNAGPTTVEDSTATSWFAANGFFISPVIDRQDTAASLLSKWLAAGQCAAFMSEGLLKLVPYGDTSTAGNGRIWVAPSAFACALDDTSFIASEGEDPVKVSSTPWQDAYNVVQIQWNNRANQYSPEITPESDQSAINRYGSRIEDPQTCDFITTLPSAAFAASMRVKRNVYTRNTYEFVLSYRYSYLEPMDIVYLTASSSWATTGPDTGIKSLPVRLTKIIDTPDGTLECTAEDYPFGVHQPTIYNKALAAGVAGPNLFADPGDTGAVVFEATDRLTGYKGNEIWIGACGANAAWGGCNILVSMDQENYTLLGTVDLPARIGELATAFPSGSDPDTTNSLVVALTDDAPALEAGSHADADQGTTLCFVGGEVVALSAVALTDEETYTANGYIRRGQMGTAISAHAQGSLFARLDSSIFKYTYDPSWAGKTIYLKFQSFNAYGNSAKDPSTLTAVPFTVPGNNPGTVDASSGLIINFTSQSLPPNIATNTGNDCTLTPVWDSGTSTWTVNGAGPGGAGTAWDFYFGQGTKSFPAFSITGLASSTAFLVVIDTRTNTYDAITTYAGALFDYYVAIGYVTTGAAGTGATGGGGGSGTGGGGFGGGGNVGPGCTVEGEPLDTPTGPVDNRDIKARLDNGELVYLTGRHGPERVIAADWMPVETVFRVAVAGHDSFECSGSHMLRTAGHYEWTQRVLEGALVETKDGYKPVRISWEHRRTRVLRIHMAGPSHEYSVRGVWTHNWKQPIQQQQSPG